MNALYDLRRLSRTGAKRASMPFVASPGRPWPGVRFRSRPASSTAR